MAAPAVRSMSKLYRFFRSVRLAIVLLLVITVLSILATLVPQGRDDSFYQATYSLGVYRLITLLHFDRFFSSLLFLAPVVLFALNLGVCAVDRFLRRMRSKLPKRYGPDIVHIGLLLLIVGSLVTALTRQDVDFTMASGEEVAITKDYSIKLLALQFQKYENGSPKAWVSTVGVLHNGKEEVSAFPIRVNHPLRLPGVSIFQTGWSDDGTITLRDSFGSDVSGKPGQGLQDGESFWYFSTIDTDGSSQRAVFQEYRGHSVVSTRILGPADRIGPYTVVRVESRPVSGLKAANDPGFLVILPAALVLAVGLVLTYLQKRREEAL